MVEATVSPDGSGDAGDAGTTPAPTPTGYALLGLLMFAGRTDTTVTAYELKQRADRTLRYYWVAPAMSQVYSEVARLEAAGLVRAVPDPAGPPGRRTTRYAITDAGDRTLRSWLAETPADFPVLKHPVALRLLMGHLVDPAAVRDMLDDYVAALAERRRDLSGVRDMLADRAEVRYPAMVADWGLAYYDAEERIVTELRERVVRDLAAGADAGPGDDAGPGTGPA
ncbi:PadR family transcriptional regulator [Cellulosimicrobium cellulans]|uniref:PadR family transcriptional regulator n=1 Tax=Cellulosimicrobium cellulans TaxID=1710 RepID=UPI00130DBDA5|nr:PadR family transcriptional regulator [Cellulosimicrobium cellulans]